MNLIKEMVLVGIGRFSTPSIGIGRRKYRIGASLLKTKRLQELPSLAQVSRELLTQMGCIQSGFYSTAIYLCFANRQTLNGSLSHLCLHLKLLACGVYASTKHNEVTLMLEWPDKMESGCSLLGLSENALTTALSMWDRCKSLLSNRMPFTNSAPLITEEGSVVGSFTQVSVRYFEVIGLKYR